MRTITALLLLPLILTGTAATGTALAQERREIPEFAALGDTTPDRLAKLQELTQLCTSLDVRLCYSDSLRLLVEEP